MVRHFLFAFLIVSISGCGAGSEGGSNPIPDDPEPISFDTFDDGRTIADEIALANTDLGLMNPADLLTTGSARFEGTAEISSTAGLNAIGIASLNVVFDSQSISGSATDFVNEDNDPVDGALALTGGDFNRNGAAGGDITATVAGNFDSANFILLQSNLSGDFYGDTDGIMMDGIVDGLVGGAPTTYAISIITESAD